MLQARPMFEVDTKLSRPRPLGVRLYLWLFQMPLAMYDYNQHHGPLCSLLIVSEDISQLGASNEKQRSCMIPYDVLRNDGPMTKDEMTTCSHASLLGSHPVSRYLCHRRSGAGDDANVHEHAHAHMCMLHVKSDLGMHPPRRVRVREQSKGRSCRPGS